MLFRLFLFFTIVPLIELAVLIWIGSKTSLAFSLALILLTGLAGALLIRHQGWHTLRRIQQDLAMGRPPADSLLDGFFVLVAAVLLITPGVLTDVAAVILLLPPTRSLLKQYWSARVRRQLSTSWRVNRWTDAPAHDEIIDVKVIENRNRMGG